MARNKSIATVTIASGASLSGAVDLGDKVLCAILVSASWTAASLSFQASDDGGTTWQNVIDSIGNEVVIATATAGTVVVAGQRISIDPSDFAGIDFIKVRSGPTGSAVNQGADRIITLISRKFYALS